ncbi:MAG: translation initiation factor IF-1 [Nanoarchaeota archaeon]|nr:translation initiation factor IF-1 [Nanoarchaeota archaeon]
MPRNPIFTVEGLIDEALPGLLFRVTLLKEKGSDGNPRKVLAHMGGKMKLHKIRVIPGDRVLVEMPNIEDRRGRIVRRL